MNTLMIVRSTTISALLLGGVASAFASDCQAFMKVSEKNRGRETVVRGRNVSQNPILAYVVSSRASVSNDYKSFTLRGVFTNGDSLPARHTMGLGTIPRRSKNGSITLDYVRLADGSSCGDAVTEEAHQLQARFSSQ